MARSLPPDTLAFITCLVTVFVDMMGTQFTAPLLVPYGKALGADLTLISLLITLRFVGSAVSQIWLPILSDRKGRVLAIRVSLLGSMVGYLIQGLAPLGCGTGSMALPELDTNGQPNVTATTAMIVNGTAAAAAAADAAAAEINDMCPHGYHVLLAGKIWSGLFSGTMSTVMAYCMELSLPDMDLMKKRQTMIFAFFMVFPICLSPIGGAVGTFGLYIPFLVSAGVAFLGFLFALRFMHSVAWVKQQMEYRSAALRKKEDGDGDADGDTIELDGGGAPSGDDGAAGETNYGGADPSDKKGAASSGKSSKKKLNPWCDGTLLCLALGFFSFGMSFTASPVILPAWLAKETFGLQDGLLVGPDNMTSVLALQQEVGKTMGVISIPQSLANVLCMTVLYFIVSKRVGDIGCIVIGGTIATIFLCLMWICTALWHIFLMFTAFGAGFGLFFGAVQNMPNRYVSRFYRDQIAGAKAVYMQGMLVGMMIGPLIAAAIYGENGEGEVPAWGYCGGTVFLATIFMAVTELKIRRSLGEGGKPAARALPEAKQEQKDRTQADDLDNYMRHVRNLLEKVLLEGNYSVDCNKHIQDLIVRMLQQAFPPIPHWESDTGKGRQAHLHAVASLYSRVGMVDEREDLLKRHGVTQAELEEAAGQEDGDQVLFSGPGQAGFAQGVHTRHNHLEIFRVRAESEKAAQAPPMLRRAHSDPSVSSPSHANKNPPAVGLELAPVEATGGEQI